MIQVHYWGNAEWEDQFATELGGIANCRFGEQPDRNTKVLVKGRPDKSDLEQSPGLEAVVVPFAGIPVSTRELLAAFPKVKLYNLHHNAADTAEMAIALYLAVAKQVVNRDQNLREGKWSEGSWMRSGSGGSVRASGKRALVLGYGAIGQRIAKVCEGLEMQVKAIRRTGPFDGRIRPAADLDVLLSETDALFVSLPLTSETEGLMDSRRIALLPDSAIISNIARGTIFDEFALYDALLNRRVAGAGIDVWWKYPTADEACLPSNLPFHELENVVMTPHVGGASDASEEHRWRTLAQVIRGIADGSAKPASAELGY